MEVDINFNHLENILQGLNNDNETMLAVNTTFARYMDPYVPMDSGVLAGTGLANITPEYVEYNTPYAHYMYEGLVYGPNIPVFEDGVIVRWFSIPNTKKYPTGEYLHYSTEKHPKATHHWDQAMLAEKKDEFMAEVTAIVSRRLNRG